MQTLDDLEMAVAEWHDARNLLDGSTDQAQMVKLMEEMGELAHAVARENPPYDLMDPIGDMLVVLINICTRNDFTLNDCLSMAYTEIRHRKGRMSNGVFIKESDDV